MEDVSNLDWAPGESTDDLIRYLRDAGELDRVSEQSRSARRD